MKDTIDSLFGEVVNDFTARISFKSGDTSGEQKIEARSFPELYKKVLDFCRNLK